MMRSGGCSLDELERLIAALRHFDRGIAAAFERVFDQAGNIVFVFHDQHAGLVGRPGACVTRAMGLHGRHWFHGKHGTECRFLANDEGVNSGLTSAPCGCAYVARVLRAYTAACYTLRPRKTTNETHLCNPVRIGLSRRMAIGSPKPFDAGASLKPAPSSAPSRTRAAPSCRGAKVTLTNTQTGVTHETTSDANGNYEFFTVRIGTYVVTAEKAGFSIALVDNVQVTVGARQRVDLSMAVGQLSEKVEVSASAVLLQTDSSDRSQVITGEQTKALPLNGREYSALALLSPGVRLSALNTGGFTPREGSFNVNGLRSTFNNFLIDGVDNNAYGTSNQGFSNQVMQPAPDAVGEFKVVTNNMSAEYGRSAGATINVAYASGTNTFRGSAWEFMRRTEMNATGFFRPATGVKPGFDRDQFGGVLGGPIVKSKAFFFADFEIFDQTRSQTDELDDRRPWRSAAAF